MTSTLLTQSKSNFNTYFFNGLFANKKIDVIRVGLQNTDEITEPGRETSEVVAGPFHPAFRQLVESGMWYDSIVEKIKKLIRKCNARGGNDNISIAYLEMKSGCEQ